MIAICIAFLEYKGWEDTIIFAVRSMLDHLKGPP